MIFIQDHLRDVRCEHVLDDSNWFSRSGIPDLDALFSSNVDFKSLLTKPCTANDFIVRVVWNEGPRVLEDSEVSGTTDQAPMLGNGSYALYFIRVRHVESLNTTVVKYVPELDHALGICRDEAVEIRQAVDANEGMLVAVERHDRSWKIRIPNEDAKVEAAADEDFVFVAVRHFANSSIVTLECLDRRDGQIAEDFIIHWLILEIRHNHFLHCGLS